MTNLRNGKEYEKIVADLGETLFRAAQNGEKYVVKYGGTNKWKGISGYSHQIDVSAQSNEIVLLIECKNWGSNVDVPPFLTFLGRVIDIRASLSDKKVFGKIVTTVDYDSGVKTLASYYEIDLDIVKNKHEFLLKFQQYGLVGLADKANGKDTVSVNRTCGVCGSNLATKANGSTWICPNCSGI